MLPDDFFAYAAPDARRALDRVAAVGRRGVLQSIGENIAQFFSILCGPNTAQGQRSHVPKLGRQPAPLRQYDRQGVFTHRHRLCPGFAKLIGELRQSLPLQPPREGANVVACPGRARLWRLGAIRSERTTRRTQAPRHAVDSIDSVREVPHPNLELAVSKRRSHAGAAVVWPLHLYPIAVRSLGRCPLPFLPSRNSIIAILPA